MGQSSPLNPGPRKERSKCPLCPRYCNNVKKNLTGIRHGLSKTQAKATMRSSLSQRSKDGRYRRICPVPDCEDIIVRLRQHLKETKRQHLKETKKHQMLTKEEKARYINAPPIIFVPRQVTVLTQTKQMSSAATPSPSASAPSSIPQPSTSAAPSSIPQPSTDTIQSRPTECAPRWKTSTKSKKY